MGPVAIENVMLPYLFFCAQLEAHVQWYVQGKHTTGIFKGCVCSFGVQLEVHVQMSFMH